MMDSKEIDQLRDHYDWSMKKASEWQLNPFEIDFHVVPADKMYEIASYSIPGHFSHWSYGRDFWKAKTKYDYGLSKIYELIINSIPSQAFLLENNSVFENMFVISHCVGHSSFFRNNVYFKSTDRDYIHSVSAAADRIRKYEIEYGRYKVEEIIDLAMTISHHVNASRAIKRHADDYEPAIAVTQYDDLWDLKALEIDNLDEQPKGFVGPERKQPATPEYDLLAYIAKYGNLEDWHRDVLHIMHEEALYFLPQRKTKIMNEGWASIIHRCMMHAADVLEDSGGISFAHMHSGVFGRYPGSLNPYLLGYEIFLDIIRTYGDHTDEEIDKFEFINGPGWEKAIEVMETCNDESFVRNYLSEKVCNDLDLFEFKYEKSDRTWFVSNKDWEDVRDSLANSLNDSGIPTIGIYEGAPNSRLRLVHEYDGRELKDNYAVNTLNAISRLWGNSCILETQKDGKPFTFTCSGDS